MFLISVKKQRTLASIILFSSIFFSLFIFNGAIDDFAPKHVILIHEISVLGQMNESYLSIQTPGFYVYGSIIEQILDLNTKSLLFWPIQFFPYILLFFCIILRLSNSYVISSLILASFITLGSTGTTKMFFWSHGLGMILFFTLILLFINLIDMNYINMVPNAISNNNKTPIMLLLIIATGSSLVFISYNAFSRASFFLLSLGMILSITAYARIMPSTISPYLVYKVLFILGVVELGISKFFYNTWLPLMTKTDIIESSGLDKFMLSYFGYGSLNPVSKNPLDIMFVTYPYSITIINIVKYFVLVVSLVLTLITIYSKYKKIDTIQWI